MMKKIVSLALAFVLLACAIFSFASCGEDGAVDIYAVANSSKATTVTTQIDYTDADGNELDAWYEIKSEGNDAIIDYWFHKFTEVDEGAVGLDRIVKVEGRYYYIDGLYYGSEAAEPEVGSPKDATYKFNLDKNKMIEPAVSDDGNSVRAAVTPENCADMFGFDLDADGNIAIEIVTNGVNLTRVELSCTTVTGARVSIRSSYSYNALDLDFSEILGEDEQ